LLQPPTRNQVIIEFLNFIERTTARPDFLIRLIAFMAVLALVVYVIRAAG
jgi:hypothetical protein